MSIGKNPFIVFLIVSFMIIGFMVKPIGVFPLKPIEDQTPYSQVQLYEWLGDYPELSFNYENNSVIEDPVFTLSWNYFTNDTIGTGFLWDFDIYINNNTNMVMETLYVPHPTPHNEIQIYGETYAFKDWGFRFRIEDYPMSLDINLTRMGVPFGTVFTMYFYIEINMSLSFLTTLVLHYDTKSIIPIVEIPAISYTYMIIGIVMLGGFIAIYYYYQTKIVKKKEEKVRYEYEE